MNKKLLFSLILLLIMLSFASFATYAYFTAEFKYEKLSEFEILSATMPDIVVNTNKNVSLFVPKKVMSKDDVNDIKPAISNYEEDVVRINVKNGANGGTTKMKYEVYYVPDIVYNKSSENILNKKELVLSIYPQKNGNKTEYNLNDLSEKTLIYNGDLTVSGINALYEEIIDVEISYYNQDFDQSENAGVEVGGHLEFFTKKIEFKK